jgi:hypothetical protein
MANRRKHANSIPVASLAKWVIAAFFLGVAGLSYVYFKNQLHATGTEIKALERQVAELDTSFEIVRGKISMLSSRAMLQRRLNEGFIKMVPISDDRIVRLNPGDTPQLAGLQPVSNKVQAR